MAAPGFGAPARWGSVSAMPFPAPPASTSRVVLSGRISIAALPRPVEIWGMFRVPGVHGLSVCAGLQVAKVNYRRIEHSNIQRYATLSHHGFESQSPYVSVDDGRYCVAIGLRGGRTGDCGPTERRDEDHCSTGAECEGG